MNMIKIMVNRWEKSNHQKFLNEFLFRLYAFIKKKKRLFDNNDILFKQIIKVQNHLINYNRHNLPFLPDNY